MVLLKSTGKIFISIFLIFALFYTFIYFSQESLIFLPRSLPTNHVFKTSTPHEEIYLEVKDGVKLHGLLIKAESAKAVILFFHGNAGSNHGWSRRSDRYTQADYDVFFLDYRGYGKSEGNIESESQLIDDAQHAYDYLKKHYRADQIGIVGVSIGTGIAAQIAANNDARFLILESPYHDFVSLAQAKFPIVPEFLIRYTLDTKTYLAKVKNPIFLIHGNDDRIIPISNSEKLVAVYPEIQFHRIKNHGHNNLSYSEQYQNILRDILVNH